MKIRHRLDALLVARGLIKSREEARRRILAGEVFVDGQRVDKAGRAFGESVAVELRGRANPYASRGGLKIEGAWNLLHFPIEGRIALDSGASTGGFTDFLIKRGAARVYAVDVGYGLIAQHLRDDPRVTLLERTNLRHLTRASVPEPIELATLDLSFIALAKILPAVVGLLSADGEIVALVKPQFEAGRADVGRGGIVRDPQIHRRVVQDVLDACRALGLIPRGAVPSPVPGQDGNREFFVYLARSGPAAALDLDALVAPVAPRAENQPEPDGGAR